MEVGTAKVSAAEVDRAEIRCVRHVGIGAALGGQVIGCLTPLIPLGDPFRSAFEQHESFVTVHCGHPLPGGQSCNRTAGRWEDSCQGTYHACVRLSVSFPVPVGQR